jgi:hypothetical protein
MLYACVQRFNVMERECKNLEFERHLNKAYSILLWQCDTVQYCNVVMVAYVIVASPIIESLRCSSKTCSYDYIGTENNI